jgi:pilus assembly protein CpaC
MGVPIASWIGLIAAFLVVVFCAEMVSAHSPVVKRASGRYAGELVLPINKSQILEVDRAFQQVTVGNPAIADVVPLSDRSLYVLGKALGVTNISILGEEGRAIAVMDVTVTYDLQGLKARLNDLFPQERIQIRTANDALVMSGNLTNGQNLSQVLAVAEQYAPGKITNLLTVRGSQQVLLEVKFAEVNRNLSRNLGFKLTSSLGGDVGFDISTVPLGNLLPNPASVATGGITVATGKFALDAFIDAGEQKGLIKVLAEPNLVAMSGETASFLAGGEFPIPVAQDSSSGIGGDTAITIEFKEFGVSLAFTPTVLGDDLINLEVAPEFSTIDESLASTQFDVPGILTRRASTTIELRNGQTFAIAGLLSNDFSDSVQQLPWLGDVPILGLLFRSSEFRRRETELVIIATPYLVKPGDPSTIAVPTDYVTPPSDAELFFMGQTEKPVPPPAEPTSSEGGQILELPTQQGGLVGDFGHIVE